MGVTVKILLGFTGVLLIALILCAYFVPPARYGRMKYVPYRYGAPGPQK